MSSLWFWIMRPLGEILGALLVIGCIIGMAFLLVLFAKAWNWVCSCFTPKSKDGEK
jgi:hypothetical protein